MNKDIKFRAWSKESDRMLDSDLITVSCMNKDTAMCAISGDDIRIRPDNEKFILMQYTGLKDKNGVEIYEGDIVKAMFYETPVIGQIGFASGCFLLFNSCVSDNQLFIFRDIEVIGNIYDTPELLSKEID